MRFLPQVCAPIAAVLSALLLAPACPAVESVRALLRADAGYDFFDLSGVLVGHSVLNHKGSYDYYDGQGMMTGWSEALIPGRIDYYDAAGNHVKSMLIDTSGGQVHLDELGKITNLGSPNYRGGGDFYDQQGRITAFGVSEGFEVVVDDKGDAGR